MLSGSGLLGGSKGNKHGRIHGNHRVYRGTNNLLDEGDGLGGKDRRSVRVFYPLDVGTIHWFLK